MACMAPDMLKNISYRPFIQNMSDWFSENPLIIQININVEKSFHHQANVKKFTFEMENTVQAGDPLNRIQQCLILPMLWASSNTTSIQFSLCVFVWGKQTSSLRWSFDRFFLHCPRNQWYLVLCLKCRQCVCACVCVCLSELLWWQGEETAISKLTKTLLVYHMFWVLWLLYGNDQAYSISLFTRVLFVTLWRTQQKQIKIFHQGQ